MRINILLLIAPACVFAGCAHPNTPVVPGDISADLHPGRVLWGIWRLDFDPVSAQARAIPVHTAAFHIDVTPYILPPACPDCLELSVTQFVSPLGILDLEASIRNPKSLTGYDVRAILRWQTGHIWLANADDYTLLFDDGGTKTLNPFIAYATENADRDFTADATHSREVQLRFSETGHFKEITFVVEASYPLHCNEPYEIANQAASGELIGLAPVTIECDVFDWQGDVTGVSLDAAPMVDDPIALTNDSDTHWTGSLANINGAAEGAYDLLLRAMSPGGAQTDSIYDYISVTVGPPPDTGLDPGPWPMLGHDASHTARSDFNGPAVEPSLVWDSATTGTPWETTYSGPSLSSDGKVFVATTSGLYCFDTDGSPEWNEPAPFSNVYPPPQPLLTSSGAAIVCYSSLLSNTDPQGVYAYDMKTGSLLWSETEFKYSGSATPKSFSVYDSPVLSEDGLLVVVAREHAIIAFDEITGAQQWVWPDDSAEYRSILPGSYLDAWRCAPALAGDGSIVAVADWFEDPRLVVLTELGQVTTDEPLTNVTTVNCHPVVTGDNEVVLAGFRFDGLEAWGAVESRHLDGFLQWGYTDDVIRVLQGTAGVGPDGSLYFLDGTGVADSTFPYDYSVYLLALSRFGAFIGRYPIFTRASAGETAVTHLRNGVTVGDNGTVYVSTSTRHASLATSYVSGVAAIDPIFGIVLWSYEEKQNEPIATSFHGTGAIGADGTVLVTRYDRVLALK